jgi:hypothetical protein
MPMAVERRRADQRQPQPDLRKLGWSVVDNERTHLGNPVNLFTDLEEFVHDHRPHGRLIADATPPAWNGYLLTVACSRGSCLSGGSLQRTQTPT